MATVKKNTQVDEVVIDEIIEEVEVKKATKKATSKKENIVDYSPKKSILDLPVKEFNFIGQSEKQIGCIAQDLQQLFPELVKEDAEGYLAIQENKLIYLLLTEVKKLQSEVETLKLKNINKENTSWDWGW